MECHKVRGSVLTPVRQITSINSERQMRIHSSKAARWVEIEGHRRDRLHFLKVNMGPVCVKMNEHERSMGPRPVCTNEHECSMGPRPVSLNTARGAMLHCEPTRFGEPYYIVNQHGSGNHATFVNPHVHAVITSRGVQAKRSNGLDRWNCRRRTDCRQRGSSGHQAAERIFHPCCDRRPAT